MKLSAYAKKLGISYQTAWNHYKASYIPNAKKLPSAIILIEKQVTNTPEPTALILTNPSASPPSSPTPQACSNAQQPHPPEQRQHEPPRLQEQS